MRNVGKHWPHPAPETNEICGAIVSMWNKSGGEKHAYPLICTSPSHTGEHPSELMRPVFRFIWEQRHGVPLSNRQIVRPKNGDWLDARFLNLELVSRSQVAKESRSVEGTTKVCTDCDAHLIFDAFAPRRNVCKECWKARLRSDQEKRSSHAEEFNCRVLDGVHYHLTDAASVKAYWWRLWFRQLHEKYPNEARYDLAVEHMRARLRCVVLSTHGGQTND